MKNPHYRAHRATWDFSKIITEKEEDNTVISKLFILVFTAWLQIWRSYIVIF